MNQVFLILAGIFTVVSVIPYVVDIFKGKTKPNVVSWLTWMILGVVGAWAAYSSNEINTAIFSLFTSLECLVVVILGLSRAKFKYEKFDIYAQLSVVVALLLWWIFNSPTLAIIAIIIIDFLGAVPTLRHLILKPFEETWQAYLLAGVGAFFGLLSLENYNVPSLSYPIYIFLINFVFVIGIITYRKKSKHES